MSNISVENYETSCRRKFEADNVIYERLISFFNSGSFVNSEDKSERRFIRRKAATFQWDAAQKILYYTGVGDSKRREVIRTMEKLADVLWFHHSSPTSGHSGVLATYNRVAAVYYWRSMREDVKHYISIIHKTIRFL
ncbi:uncharacterized protein LOC123500977 isoform X2 [Portunus trituberculatus]|uniref:uncharacterized protein LOC123500977 isoform X2 n=1 Tax=Portunus trituberculatus TaxID=210409 RepID=UPI001E1CC36C|nr:uncharacterized protein LOC123500977 isoform X2 [Portunus trituberculatus]